MALGQLEPLSVVVGRQLALNQNVDPSTATRHALVGALIGSGFVGPILARELASRDARAAAPPLPPPDPSTPETPGATVDRMIHDFQEWIKSQKNTEEAMLAKAAELQSEVRAIQAKRIEALEQLRNSVQAWQVEYELASSSPSKTRRQHSGETGS